MSLSIKTVLSLVVPFMLFACADVESELSFDDFTNRVKAVAGEGAEDCGVAAIGEGSDQTQCVAFNFGQENPSFAIFNEQGSDSTIANAFAYQCREEILKAPAVPSAPHAFNVGDVQSVRGGGDGGRGRSRGLGNRTHRSLGYGWTGGPRPPFGQRGLGRRRQRRRQQRYRFEGHCGYCGQWGHCILANRFWAQSSSLVQPHATLSLQSIRTTN